ncbi:serine hydrolase [Flavobacterium sp. J27]|uniref:serine hydrolase n=1 Tax=Flavobacterium sp. J27 TaxID=2060419 RepID=UPI001031450C|nr:serine hydrolase [Flavobacterium sp. J27]
METQTISKNLVYQRKLKGYTQEELSEKTQVTVRTIQRIEKGEVTPHLQTIKLLAIALHIEVEDLIPLENPKEENMQIKWLLLLHGTPILGLILPLCNILFPLFLWIHKREDNTIYDVQGRKVINFQINMTLLYILSFITLLTIEGWGFFFFIAVIPFSVIISFVNILKTITSQTCYYPLSFPFLKIKKTTNIIAVISGLLFFVFPTTMHSQNIERLDNSTVSSQELTSRINQLMQAANVEGMAITIFNNNKSVYQKTFGYKESEKKLPLESNTNIYGASFSKAIFSVLVMKLVEEKLIDLDTPLVSYLPKKIYEYKPQTRWHDDFSSLKKDSLYEKITARMCLSHTTGFANYRWFEKDQQLHVNFEPGSQYSYSGEGFIFLQVVLEKLTGKGLEELAQELIFKPLKMSRSSYHWKKEFESDFAYGYTSDGKRNIKDTDNEPRGGGTLETTASDYTQFLTAVLQRKILTPSSWKEIIKPQIRIKSQMQFGEESKIETNKYNHIALSYGLGWGVFQTPYGPGMFKEGHGGGFQHYSILFPKAKIGIMIMTNSDNSESIFKEILEMSIKDTFTPYEWENYIPYTERK